MAGEVRHWDAFAFALRVVMALVWLYNGLWLKVLSVDPHHAQIVASTLGHPVWLTAIGIGESLLALGILSGVFSRLVNLTQIVLLVAMNAVGILCSGQIDKPWGLVISNLPLFMCALAVALYGPGRWTFQRR